MRTKKIKASIARKLAILGIKALLGECALPKKLSSVSDEFNCFLEIAKESNWELPLRWLLHYLEGSGEDMIVPDYVIEEAQRL